MSTGKGPVGIITGALSGIGAATALEFARLGASLILADIETQSGDEMITKAAELGGTATVAECDVTDYAAVERLVARTTADLGRLDFLVANAGIAEQSRIASGDPARWARVVQTNLLGTMHCVRAALPVMRRQGEGHVLIVGSTSGREPYVGEPSYLASKYGVVGFAYALRMECAEYGVRATVVEPGTVDTPLTRRPPAVRALLEQMHPLAPEDVARALVFTYQQPPHVVISELVIRPLDEAVNADMPDAEPR
ncbi:MAG: SDR family oxidoreductase [Solirubrobacterales bacterium]|nr:SDR family oxidoreductase [Solirubrobacterales bacterium]MBV9165058.1 SDR family oxidoreductase [Solirubrobacterales bacterium]